MGGAGGCGTLEDPCVGELVREAASFGLVEESVSGSDVAGGFSKDATCCRILDCAMADGRDVGLGMLAVGIGEGVSFCEAVTPVAGFFARLAGLTFVAVVVDFFRRGTLASNSGSAGVDSFFGRPLLRGDAAMSMKWDASLRLSWRPFP